MTFLLLLTVLGLLLYQEMIVFWLRGLVYFLYFSLDDMMGQDKVEKKWKYNAYIYKVCTCFSFICMLEGSSKFFR